MRNGALLILASITFLLLGLLIVLPKSSNSKVVTYKATNPIGEVISKPSPDVVDPNRFDNVLSEIPVGGSPATVEKLITEGKERFAIIDLLEYNPEWTPGGSGEQNFYNNSDPTLYKTRIDPNAKYFLCGLGPDDNFTTADVETDMADFNEGLYWLGFKNSVLVTVEEVCLP